jgi:hypothetical protein
VDDAADGGVGGERTETVEELGALALNKASHSEELERK